MNERVLLATRAIQTLTPGNVSRDRVAHRRSEVSPSHAPLTAHPGGRAYSAKLSASDLRQYRVSPIVGSNLWSRGGQVNALTGAGSSVSDGGIIGQAYGRKIHAREVVAIDEAGNGQCWVLLTRFGDNCGS